MQSQSLYTLRNENEVKIERAIMKDYKAETQTVLLTIRLMDQIASKQWSHHVLNDVERGSRNVENIRIFGS